MDFLPSPLESSAIGGNGSFHILLIQKNRLSSARSSVLLQQYAIYEMNAMLWALLIVLTGMLLMRLGKLMLLWLKGSRLPGPPCPTFAGHASSIAKAGGPDSFTTYLSKLHKEYGPVVRLWLGPTRLLVSVKDPKLVENLLVQAKDRIPTVGKALHLVFGKGSPFTASYTQIEKRRSHLYEEFNGKLIGEVYEICQKVVIHWKNQAGEDAAGCGVDSEAFSQHLAFTVLGTALFGDIFLSWSSAEEFGKLLLLVSKEACFWAAYSALLFWNKKFQRYKKNCLRLQALTEEIVSKSRLQHEQRLAESQRIRSLSEPVLESLTAGIAVNYNGAGASFIEDMIFGVVAGHEWPKPFYLSEELRGSLIGLMFHGALTTAGILSGALIRLAQNPHVQAKVLAEIDDVCKRSLPTADDVNDMHYLMAMLHESGRLMPSGPLLQRSSLVHDLKLGQNITVPAGAIIAVPVQLMQMDACSWGQDAEVFNPERFLVQHSLARTNNNKRERTVALEEHKNKSQLDDSDEKESEGQTNLSHDGDSDGEKTGSVEEKLGSNKHISKVNIRGSVFKNPWDSPSFLLFGAGARSCIGRNFAVVEITTLLATLLQGFKIKLGPGGVKDFKPKIENCILHLSPSPKLIFEPRHHH